MEPKKNIDWAKLLRDHIENPVKINTSAQAHVYNIRYTMKKQDIMTFVSGLHEIQSDMIEETVALKERQGFPEATEVIDRIRALK
jgi:hypothetical protein